MPKYGFLSNRVIDGKYIADVMTTHRMVGVPYTDEMIDNGKADFTAQADPDADTAGLEERYAQGVMYRNFDGAARADRDGCADRLSAGAGHDGRLLDLHPRGKPVRGTRMETYTFLREFADSWMLLALTLFFLGVVVWAFRPGAARPAGRGGQQRSSATTRNPPGKWRLRSRHDRRPHDPQHVEGAVEMSERKSNRKPGEVETTGHSLGRHRRVQQSAAALVGVDLLCLHRLGARLLDRLSRPGR